MKRPIQIIPDPPGSRAWLLAVEFHAALWTARMLQRRHPRQSLRTDPARENGRTVSAGRAAAMYADYQAGLSLAQVAEKWGRTRQSVFGLFEKRGWKLRAKQFQARLLYGGRSYTPDPNGYWRDTVLRSAKYAPGTFLHRRVWTDTHGPIPPGHDVVFKDGNRANLDIGNLECIPHPEQQARGRKGVNQFTVTAKARLGTLLAHHSAGRHTVAASLKAA